MDAGENPPTGFFHGYYGGPRTNVPYHTTLGNLKNNFAKTKNENLDPASSRSDVTQHQHPIPRSLELLNEDILEGCANLMDQTGKRVQVILRDGRILVGELSSVDHFSNILLRDAVERIVVGKQFGDIIRGIYIIREDNVALVGEIDPENEAEMERVLQQVPVEEIKYAKKCHQDIKREKQLKYTDALKQRGVAFPRQLEDEF